VKNIYSGHNNLAQSLPGRTFHHGWQLLRRNIALCVYSQWLYRTHLVAHPRLQCCNQGQVLVALQELPPMLNEASIYSFSQIIPSTGPLAPVQEAAGACAVLYELGEAVVFGSFTIQSFE